MKLYFELYDQYTKEILIAAPFTFHVTHSFTPNDLLIVQKFENEDLGEFNLGKDESIGDLIGKGRHIEVVEQVVFGYIIYKNIEIHIEGYLYITDVIGETGFVIKKYQCYRDENPISDIILTSDPNIYNLSKYWEVINRGKRIKFPDTNRQ